MSIRNAIKEISKIVGEENISTSEVDRIIYGRGVNSRSIIICGYGVYRQFYPEAIVWPIDTAHVVAVMKYCHKNGIRVIPYGCGTEFLSTTNISEEGIILDLKKMDSIIEINQSENFVDVQAGVSPGELENELKKHGLSIKYCSIPIFNATIGSWIATDPKASELILKMRVITPEGEIIELSGFPQSTDNSALIQIFSGCHGTAGIITEARLKINPLPPVKIIKCFNFQGFKQGIECAREISQMNIAPSFLYLHDTADTFLISILALQNRTLVPEGLKNIIEHLTEHGITYFLKHPYIFSNLITTIAKKIIPGALMVACFEGQGDVVESKLNILVDITKKHSGVELDDEWGTKWLSIMNSRIFIPANIFKMGGVYDCIDIWTLWHNVLITYNKMVHIIRKNAFLSAYLFQTDANSCRMRFSFYKIPSSSKESNLDVLDKIHSLTTRAIIQSNGTAQPSKEAPESILPDINNNIIMQNIKKVFDLSILLPDFKPPFIREKSNK